MLKITVELEKEQIKEAFENAEIKSSAKKIKALIESFEYAENDIQERLEELLMEILEEMVHEEFGE